MERMIEMKHVTLQISADFDVFTQKLETLLGRFDYALYKNLDGDPQLVQKQLESAAGEEGLMLFNVQDHGKLLKLAGMQRKAKQYILGNPLIALTMTQHDIRAGLYAPLRIFVYEDTAGAIQVEFDQPSSLFGQFDNSDILRVAQSLDHKLTNLIGKAESQARSSQSAAAPVHPA